MLYYSFSVTEQQIEICEKRHQLIISSLLPADIESQPIIVRASYCKKLSDPIVMSSV
jgi:hypothetical protein